MSSCTNAPVYCSGSHGAVRSHARNRTITPSGSRTACPGRSVRSRLSPFRLFSSPSTATRSAIGVAPAISVWVSLSSVTTSVWSARPGVTGSGRSITAVGAVPCEASSCKDVYPTHPPTPISAASTAPPPIRAWRRFMLPATRPRNRRSRARAFRPFPARPAADRQAPFRSDWALRAFPRRAAAASIRRVWCRPDGAAS